MKNKLKFFWHLIINKTPGFVFFNLNEKEQKKLLLGNEIDVNIRYTQIDKRVIDLIIKKITKTSSLSSLYENDKSWDDVISGYSLENNFNKKEEKLLDNLIKYLNKEYPDVYE